MYNVWKIVLIDCLLSFLLQNYSPLVGSYIKKTHINSQFWKNISDPSKIDRFENSITLEEVNKKLSAFPGR